MSREVVIVDAVSTAFGKQTKSENGRTAAKQLAFLKGKYVRAAKALVGLNPTEKGALADVTPQDLGAVPIKSLIARNAPKLQGNDLDDVIYGCAVQVDGQAMNIARLTALAAGLPDRVGGLTVTRLCGSSLEAVVLAHAKIATNQADCIVAGGVEHMNAIPMMADIGGFDRIKEIMAGDGTFSKELAARVGDQPLQHFAAEAIAQKWKLTRNQLDRFGAGSFMKYAAAKAEGHYARFTVPVGNLTEHEGVRHGKTYDETLSILSKLKPSFPLPGFKLTATTSSRVVDGASAVLVMDATKASHLGLKARARVVQSWSTGSDPKLMLTGPIECSRECLRRAGLTVGDIAVWEYNEAFASVVLAGIADLELDPKKVNVWGGAIAHGHALGATGGCLVAKVINILEVTNQRYAMVTMCVGFGQAVSVIIENLSYQA
jgi:acetyl-CoA C-acetyltransferase